MPIPASCARAGRPPRGRAPAARADPARRRRDRLVRPLRRRPARRLRAVRAGLRGRRRRRSAQGDPGRRARHGPEAERRRLAHCVRRRRRPLRRPGRPGQPRRRGPLGVAEFAAAEELDRARGHWWSPDGVTLLAARVDESALQRRYFTDPAHPELPAEDFAYPEAGGPNADVQLWVLREGAGEAAEGPRIRIDWDAETYPYVSDAGWESAEEILLTVQDRLQQNVLLLSADPATGRTRELSRTTHPQWVDPLVPGTPARLADGRMLTAADTPGGAARALAVDGQLLTGDGIQVRRVAGSTRTGC
ncbi:DPP IV N-terminal domain-containing protein [Streptomyces sp. MS1.HAVA.3]|uniref:DPP IV N-terminal domain-containing protein n=1 Tax=Streptomyces caledonius TaxID=3134107 RepID=A0ABU8U2J3_9ACTN